MTISDTMSQLWASSLQSAAVGSGTSAQLGLPNPGNSIEFRLGPEHTPVQSMRRARAFVAKVLPALLAGAPSAKAIEEATLAVLAELVDITARHRAGIDLSGRVSYDGEHVLIAVGDMDQALPAPEEEPGLFIVRRLVDDVGQYRSDDDGYATWASIPVRSRPGTPM
ncbi:hypothetical protein SSP531S_58090 [Streptomyces spongiicola]|uniref:ATP-binding protein n=1 Tax=Streptomyces spongiicola TaxID=1690221 RepID=A0A388T9B3_9ACTN|nr:hypothetical protein [Streptomyces spongiicola]GBQ04315.1 hypothetical protein SSP531S_58090 [Streptomyces spongiicola]